MKTRHRRAGRLQPRREPNPSFGTEPARALSIPQKRIDSKYQNEENRVINALRIKIKRYHLWSFPRASILRRDSTAAFSFCGKPGFRTRQIELRSWPHDSAGLSVLFKVEGKSEIRSTPLATRRRMSRCLFTPKQDDGRIQGSSQRPFFMGYLSCHYLPGFTSARWPTSSSVGKPGRLSADN